MSGAVLYRDNLTDAGAPAVQTGTAEAWEYYPSDIATGGSGVAQSVTFPVFDGGALFGPNAWVFKDIKDDSYPDPSDDVAASDGLLDWSGYTAPLDTTTANQNCSTSVACTWDKNVGFSWKANAKHDAVQVYYFLNRFHDHLAGAPISFTDAAGNFEYGGTGGHDPVLGNASDGANTAGGGFPDLGHVDNANMTTPPDGTPPTMQMYLFRKLNRFGLPDVASANGGDDAEVVYHEYTHGLSNRLVLYPGGNSGLDNQQADSMGEGWSDWYALDFLVGEGYKPNPAGRRQPRDGGALVRRRPAHAAGRLPGRLIQPELPRHDRRRSRRVHVRGLRPDRRRSRGARRRRDLAGDAVGPAPRPGPERHRGARHARDGAVPAEPVVPRHAQRDPAGRRRGQRRRQRGRDLERVRQPRDGLLRLIARRWRREPGRGLRTPAGSAPSSPATR